MAKKKKFPYNTPVFRDGIVTTKYKLGTSKQEMARLRKVSRALALKNSRVWEWDFRNRRKRYIYQET